MHTQEGVCVCIMWFPQDCEGTTNIHFRLFSPISFIYRFLTACWATATVCTLVSGEWNSLLESRESENEGERERESSVWGREGGQPNGEKDSEVISCSEMLVKGRSERRSRILMIPSESLCAHRFGNLRWSVQSLEPLSAPFAYFVWRLGRRAAFSHQLAGGMDFLLDPTVMTPVLVVTFHFLTAAGFWFYRRRRRRQTPCADQGKPRRLEVYFRHKEGPCLLAPCFSHDLSPVCRLKRKIYLLLHVLPV